MKGKIQFFTENVRFNIKRKNEIRQWLHGVIEKEGGQCGTLTYIFCNDEYLSNLNNRFLKHTTLTDILTFQTNGKEEAIAGEIFISVDRVTENAEKYHVNFEEELRRVMVHGVLHLLGYKDKMKDEKVKMRQKEDCYLGMFPTFKG
ncbi:MAG TPA: rRNA maturation RNase YbeY [Bacteroidales bacterium]|jgi:rRNA maturation RNase YbeY|nr:rRNA maturation RNase YbeY [Bacteroidales bacterium]